MTRKIIKYPIGGCLLFINEYPLHLAYGCFQEKGCCMGVLDFLKPQQKATKGKKQEIFELDALDEVVIQKLSDDVVEDVAYLLKMSNNSEEMTLGRKNPYRSQDTRDLLKYQLNSALRQLSRQRKIHFGRVVEKNKSQHPLIPYLKAYLFDAVRDEITSPSL